MIQVAANLGATLASAGAKGWAMATSLPLVGAVLCRLQDAIPDVDDQNILSFVALLVRYRSFDFTSFMRSHREALKQGQETGDYVPGVCNYYRLMADIITLGSGPFWHFVPMTEGRSRKECHDQFHHRMASFLAARPEDKILEYGCGFGEIGRQVALISGASVTGLTMADEEIAGGNERIKRAGLEGRCAMVQGNYHKMPFEDQTFDKVFGVYTLKYSADLTTAISEMARVLKPGGRFVSYEILVATRMMRATSSTGILWTTSRTRLACPRSGRHRPCATRPARQAWLSRRRWTSALRRRREHGTRASSGPGSTPCSRAQLFCAW